MRAVLETRQIGRDLRAALEGLDNGQLAAANIESKVGLVRAQVLGFGFNGIASGLAAIQQSLTAVRSKQASVADKARSCEGPVSSIGEDSTPKDVITQLSSVVATAEGAAAAVTGVIDEFAAISKQIAATLDGGKPEKLLALVSDVVNSLLEPARKKLQAVKAGAEAAVAEARRAGQLALGGGGGLDLTPLRQFESIGDQVTDPDERTGARIQSGIDDADAAGRMEKFARSAARRGDDLSDSITDTVYLVQDGMAKTPPTGHTTSSSVPSATAPGPQNAAATDVVTGTVAAAALIAGAVRAGVKHWREHQHDKDDDGHH